MDASSSTITAESTEKARRVADILNDPNISTVNYKKMLRRGGVLCTLTMKRKRLTSRLTHKDLGLVLDATKRQKMDDIFTLGMKNLLPTDVRKRFERIDDNARNVIKKYGARTALGYFVPVTVFREFLAEMRAAEAEYFRARDEVFANYSELKRKVISDYAHVAGSAYDRLALTNPEELASEKKRSTFLQKARRRIRSMFPTEQSIKDSFVFDLKMGFIDLSIFESQEAGSEEEESALEGLSVAQLDELRWQQQAAVNRTTMIAEMEKEVALEARRKKRKTVDGFLGEIVASTRILTYEALTTVLTSVTKNEYLHPKSAEQLENLINITKGMQFYDDADMDRVREKLSDILALGGTKNSPSVQQIREQLAKLATVMRASFLPLLEEEREEREDEPLRLASLGIAYDPTIKEEKEARQALGMRLPFYLDEREEREDEALSMVAVPAGFDEEPEEREL